MYVTVCDRKNFAPCAVYDCESMAELVDKYVLFFSDGTQHLLSYNEFMVRKATESEVEEYCEARKKEMVNHPKHYGGDTEYECIKVLEAWLPLSQYIGFLRGNAIKYLCRAGNKDDEIQELEKSKWYINKLIEIKTEIKEGGKKDE